MNTSLKINEYHFKNTSNIEYYIYNHSYFTDVYRIPNEQLINETSEMSNIINATSKITKEKLILDVGANCGLFTVPCSLNGFDVIAFEPVKSNIELLKMGFSKNKCEGITLCEFALSNFNGERDIYIPNCTDNSSFNSEVAVSNLSNKEFKPETVRCVKFDDWYKDNITKKVGLIKMDVQGFEYEVLEGMTNFLNNSNDIYLLLEWDERHTIMAGFSLEKIDSLLKELGFSQSDGLYPGGDLLFYKN